MKLAMTELQHMPMTLTVDEVAEVLRIGRTTAYTLARQRDFPTIRVGRRIVIPRDAFARWIEGQAEAVS